VTVNGLLGRQCLVYPTPTVQQFAANQGGSAGRMGPVRPSLATLASLGYLPSRLGPKMNPDGNASSPNGPNSRLLLNVRFVEHLMGWPVGWTLPEENIELTAYGPAETASCPRPPPSRSAPSCSNLESWDLDL
jgi:hypothetical protein